MIPSIATLRLAAGAAAAGLLLWAALVYRASLIEHGRQLERTAAAARAAEHEIQVRAQERQAASITQEIAHDIETQRAARAEESRRAAAVLQPVRLCQQPTADRPAVPRAAGPAAAADGAAAATELPLRAGDDHRAAGAVPGPDVGPELIAMIVDCQREHDDAQGWRAWWREQRTAPSPR